MKKALDQTLRDLKRGVNKKVLKVPGIEQKVLDATSNEPWGPHGSNLSDIANATKNYHEYQLIMAVVWKRINDTGKNWRHVYKALTVLEYLVAHGSERVIEEIREHAYQISTLSDFQYIDSSGRDQGSNVRKKSQSLVVLVNDKEKIQEVRQKAQTNRDKFRNASSTGGMYKPGGDRNEDDRFDGRYGNRDDERNGYRDDDRYSRDGDRYGRDSDDQYGRDGSRDGEYRGRSQSVDDYRQGSRSRSSEGYRERSFDDDRYSSRSSGARAEDKFQEDRRLERKFSEQNIGAPPTYEEAVSDARSPVHNERDGEIAEAPAPKTSSPTGSTGQVSAIDAVATAASPAKKGSDSFDEFDPRGPVSAPPPTASNGEMDLLGSLSESFSSNALALMPATSQTSTSEADAPINSGSGSTFVALSSATTVLNQPIEDPFGDSPFKAIPTTDDIPSQPQNNAACGFQSASMGQSSEPVHTPATGGFGFEDELLAITYTPSNVQAPSTDSQFLPAEHSFGNQETDILADILPPPGPSAQSVPQSSTNFGNYGPPSGYTDQSISQAPGYAIQSVSQAPQGYANQSVSQAPGYANQSFSQAPGYATQQFSQNPGYPTQSVSQAPGYATQSFAQAQGYAPQSVPQGPGYASQSVSQGAHQAPTVPPQRSNSEPIASYLSQLPPTTSQEAPTVPTGLSANAQVPKKFEPKSTVWADTLSRGLVNLNISGPKTNPLADIGVDFDSINRRDKRERPAAQAPVTSTITMGKAMGSGSGIGRAGAGASAIAPRNPMTNPGMGMNMNMGMGMGMGGGMGGGMGMGMGMNSGAGMNMGNYGGGMNQNPGMGMGTNMGMNMGGVGQGRPPMGGLPQGPNMQGNYNTNNHPMLGGQGGYPPQGYPPQQQYGGGYR